MYVLKWSLELVLNHRTHNLAYQTENELPNRSKRDPFCDTMHKQLISPSRINPTRHKDACGLKARVY